MAAHWLLSIDCMKKVGGFSPTFPHYGEDDNYAQRVLFHDFKIGVVIDSKAVHDRELRVNTPQKRIYLGYINSLNILSNINSNHNRIVLSIFEIVRNLLKYKCFLLSIKYLYYIIIDYRSIRKNRIKSQYAGAFL